MKKWKPTALHTIPRPGCGDVLFDVRSAQPKRPHHLERSGGFGCGKHLRFLLLKRSSSLFHAQVKRGAITTEVKSGIGVSELRNLSGRTV